MPLLIKPAISPKKNFKVPIINGLAVSFILFVGVYFLILPAKKNNDYLKEVKAKNELVLARQQLVISDKDALVLKIERLNTAIPGDPQILKLGSTLQIITVKSGMLLKSLNFNDSGKTVNKSIDSDKSAFANQDIENKNIAVTSFKVVLVGSEDGFKKFLQAVESNLRLIDVVDMGIPEQKQDNSGNNTYTLELNGYYLPNVN